MAEVNLSIGSVAIGNVQTAPTFEVSDASGKLGELISCRGGLYWKTKNARKWVQVSWSDFDRFASELASNYPQASIDDISSVGERGAVMLLPEQKSTSFFAKLFGKKI